MRERHGKIAGILKIPTRQIHLRNNRKRRLRLGLIYQRSEQADPDDNGSRNHRQQTMN